jgi:hypothetical protein
MNKTSFFRLYSVFLYLLIVSAFVSCGKKEDAPKTENKDTVKTTTPPKTETPTSAHVVFNVTGDRVGTDDAYLSGKKMRQVMDVKKDGVMKKITLISDGKTFYLISETGGKKLGMKMPLDSSKDFTMQKSPGEDFEDFVSKLNSFPTVGSETILDKKCDLKITPHKDTMAVYMGFPLKANFRSKGFYMIATKFEPDPKITDDMFVPPTDVEYIDLNMLRRK